MRRHIVRVAAVVVVSVFACLPTLARIHDRLSTRDDVSGFRLSKNLERPHEKIVAVATTAPPVPVASAPAWHHSLVDVCTVALTSRCANPLAPRAPPAR